MTFLLITFFIAIAFSGFQDLVNRTNITAYSQQIYYSSPPLINFSSRQLKLALTFNNYLINDPRYFKLELIQALQTTNPDGSTTSQYINQIVAPCTLTDFPPDLTANLLQINPNISTFLCLKNDTNVLVQGAYSSQVFSYFWIKLSKCQNTTNLTCFSDDVIQNTFQTMGRVYLNFYISNNIISPNDFQNPASSFLDDRIYEYNIYRYKCFDDRLSGTIRNLHL